MTDRRRIEGDEAVEQEMKEETPTLLAIDVSFNDKQLVVHLEDGRIICVPMWWYPRLYNASDAERADWRFIGRGMGIHWPQIDEDLSVRGMLREDAKPVPGAKP